VLWDPSTTRAAFSAVCALTGGRVGLAAITAAVSVRELAAALRALGARDALLLGGSGDVCLWAGAGAGAGAAVLTALPRRESTRAGVAPGERPLNAVLAAFRCPALCRSRTEGACGQDHE
jgi:hypothetical protein